MNTNKDNIQKMIADLNDYEKLRLYYFLLELKNDKEKDCFDLETQST